MLRENRGIVLKRGEIVAGADSDVFVDLVIADPPYGIKRDKGFGGFRGFRGFGKQIASRRYENDNWDDKRPDKIYFDEILRIGKLVMIFGGNFFADILPRTTHWIVWDKLNTMPTFSDCELIWTNSKRKSVKKITHLYNGLIGKEEWRVHPTQKPVALMKKIIADYSKNSDTILDPFLGSGTTLVACKELGRRGIGIEISEEYCKIAINRLKNTQKLLF